jgi:GNAT superfamily N-acetyltransferase
MTNDAYTIVPVEKPEEAAWGIIGNGLQQFNLQQAGPEQFTRLCFAVLSSEEVIVGGVLGELYWDWLHIDLMWIPDELRGRGLGQRLLAAIEAEARRRGAKHAFLDTFSFQAPEFYRKQGYRLFGSLPGFPSGFERLFLTKALVE